MKRRSYTLWISLLAIAVLTIILGSAASAMDVPFVIDGNVPDAGTSNLPDQEGNAKELGPLNSNTTKLGVIDDDVPSTLGNTNPNGQVDFADAWVATEEDEHGNIWFYYGWTRDANKGSGVVSIELGANPPPPECDYSLIGTADEQLLIDNCNPWANRATGDTLFSWDQQGNNLVIEKRTFDDDNDTWGPGTAIPATDAIAAYSADGFSGEVAINLTATIFTPGECLSVGNVIPGTITGNSDSADYKDTVLGDTGISISNCGAVRVIKEDDAGNRLNGVTFNFYQDNGDEAYVPADDNVLVGSCTTASGTVGGVTVDGVCTVNNLLINYKYWVVEDTSTIPAGYDPASPPQQLATVVKNSVTELTFVNPRQRGSIIIEKVVKGTTTRIDGASFALDEDGDAATTGDQTSIGGVSGETGLFCIDNLLFGTYNVVETAAPSGYSPVTLVQSYAVTSKSDCSDAASRSVNLTFENEAQPALTTSATPTATVGGTIFDTATLSGGFSPTGDITFKLYLNDNTCTDAGALVFEQTVSVDSGNGDYTTNSGYVASAAGTYYWIANYSGDGSNAAAGHDCGVAGEVTTVNKEGPTISTLATSTATVSESIFDTATLSGGFNPTGTINFKLYLNDNTCTDAGALVFEQNVSVDSGNGDYSTNPGYVTSAAGTYYWLASYSGDANNDPAGHACGAAGEVSTVNKAQPSLSTTPKLLPNDDATLSGGFGILGGSLSFELHASADCSGDAIYAEEVAVSGAGTYGTNNTTVFITSDGTYSWLVSYSGDGNNNAGFSLCDAEQQVIDFTPLGE